MRKLTFLLFIILTFAACKKDDCSNGNPSCIDLVIENHPNELLTVQRIDAGGEYHYWLNTGDNAFDGPEYIVNESCDTVCVFCFCPPDPCLDAYESGEWEIIWQQ